MKKSFKRNFHTVHKRGRTKRGQNWDFRPNASTRNHLLPVIDRHAIPKLYPVKMLRSSECFVKNASKICFSACNTSNKICLSIQSTGEYPRCCCCSCSSVFSYLCCISCILYTVVCLSFYAMRSQFIFNVWVWMFLFYFSIILLGYHTSFDLLHFLKANLTSLF